MYPSPVSFRPMMMGSNRGDNINIAVAENKMSKMRLMRRYILRQGDKVKRGQGDLETWRIEIQ